ncbi:MAG TPA: type II secretion system secretin GspD [Rhodocyclaceae bacterium]|nr:type II secretion system secretin GspD [Rhodocyclaceae bacterium]
MMNTQSHSDPKCISFTRIVRYVALCLSSLCLSLSLSSALWAADSQPAVVTTTTAATTAAAETKENGDNVSLNFNNADIDAVVRAIGKISGKNFILDPRVKGTLNIVTNRPVPRSMTYSILLSALRLQGYAVIEGGGVVKIVPEADAKLHAVPVGKDRAAALAGDKIVTEVFQIKNESAAQLVQVVRPLVTPNNTVSVYPNNNSLVITDYAENIARIGRIIESIDVPQGDAQVLPIVNASAVDLAAMLNRLFADGAGQPVDASQRVTILADGHSNSLLIRSENRSRLQAVRSMAAQLDQPGAAGTVRVIYLKNADATKVAQTLRSALSGEAPPTTTTTSNTQSGSGANVATSATSTSTGGNSFVFADVPNNALIVTGPDAVYNSVRDVVDKLDRRPAQIYIEALIAEVTADKSNEFGIQWQSGIPTSGKTTVFGGTNFGAQGSGVNILSVAQNPANVSNGLNLAVGGGTITFNGTPILNIDALLHALNSDSRSNILSTPSLVTVDNEEAKIVVGQNVPFVTGTFTTTSTTTSNPFQTIERKDVGLTLKIKPQITEGGTVRLLISQEVSAVLASTASNINGPTTTKRSLDSVVIADDGAIVALGGLIQDNSSTGVDKVPLLGDIPVLGSLFRYETKSRSKTNLLIFLRPVIIRNSDDAKRISEDRYDYMIGKQKTNDSPDNLMKGDTEFPQLPSPPPAPSKVPLPQQ